MIHSIWNVDLKKAGKYKILVKIASKNTEGIRIAVQTENGKSTFNVKNTGGWQTYEVLSLDAIDMKKGRQVIKIMPDEGKGPHVNLLEIKIMP